jgi:hypothetical protein
VQDHIQQGRTALLHATETGDGELPDPGADLSPPNEDVQAAEIGRLRPSEYLRSRCPLCFGGIEPMLDAM